MKEQRLILSKKFNNSISTRIAVENLLKNIKTDELIIDFSDISFISSSAAHQMVIEIRLLEQRNINVKCENMNPDVSRMIELSKTDRKNLFTTIPSIKHSIINSNLDLSRLFLEGIQPD
jgi:anti-anti-sigma factor